MLEPVIKKTNHQVEWMRWTAIGGGLKILAFFLMRQGKKEALLGRALAEFEGVYKFESGDKKFSRYLVLKNGKVMAKKKYEGEHNFLFTLYEPAKMRLRARQEMVLEIIIGNKIGQSGNLYYLYQFGFLISLLDRSFKRKKMSRSLQVERAGSASG